MSKGTGAARGRNGGRPATGKAGPGGKRAHVASYPKVRVEPGALDQCRQLARSRGVALHVVVGELLVAGLR